MIKFLQIVFNGTSLFAKSTFLPLSGFRQRHFSVSNVVIEARSKYRIGVNVISLRCYAKNGVKHHSFFRIGHNFWENFAVFLFGSLQSRVIPANCAFFRCIDMVLNLICHRFSNELLCFITMIVGINLPALRSTVLQSIQNVIDSVFALFTRWTNIKRFITCHQRNCRTIR